MITQAGLYKLDLYEKKGIAFTYDSNDDILTISNTGDVLNFETNENEPKYNNEKQNAANNQVNNSQVLEFVINDLSQENLETIEKIMTSIYGWVPLLETMDGKKYIINIPLFPTYDTLESQVSHTFKVELTPRIRTLKELQNYVG